MTFTLNNGVEMPAVGLGVFQSAPSDTVSAVESALRTGYRHIDTAASYHNEREVGEGIRRSGVDRSEVFVETKVWVTDYGFDATLRAFGKASAKLGVDYLDLFILHQPAPERFGTTIEAYRGLEKLLADGKVRAIGVSNFTESQLGELLDACTVVPAVNQVELHPYFAQPALQRADAARGILTQAWSPIGGITFYWDADGSGRRILAEPSLQRIAEAHGKTTAQVVLRWHLQQGRSAVPKSTNPERIAENIDIFDFALSSDELAAVDALDTGVRSGPDPTAANPGRFEITIPEA